MSPAPQPVTNNAPAALGQLDRFELLKILGEGTQGVVYLGFDPNLQRQVAIKAISTSGNQSTAATPTSSDMKTLLREARTVSQFQHPNIVSIYEIGFIDAEPYLVLEYIDGPLLSHTIKAHKDGVPLNHALALIKQIVDGLAYAHNHGIIHGDLKPANVLVTSSGIAKIADFGIARRIGEKTRAGLAGSPRYMAPEYIAHRAMTPAVDQYAAGILFFQLLTGKHPVTGKSLELIFAQISADAFPAPSSINPDIPPEIDAIVVRALSSDPDHRFNHICDFKLELEAYQADQLTSQTLRNARPTVDSLRTLRQRIRSQKDFPALSTSITNLNNLFADNQKSAPAIAILIAKDLALTSKVMRIANSAYIPNAGGEIATLSHAVMMLGFTTVREIASSLLMIDLIKGGEDSLAVKEQLVRSLFSATLTRKIAIRQGAHDIDTSYLAGMFYRLGKLLICFHMPEEQLKICELTNQCSGEDEAANRVLGYSYIDMGSEIAADWSLPEGLLDSIQVLNLQPDAPVPASGDVVYAALSNDIADLLAATDEPLTLRPLMANLLANYRPLINISDTEIEEILDGSRTEFQKYCSILKIETTGIALMQCFENWADYFPVQTVDNADSAVLSELSTLHQPQTQNHQVNDQTTAHSSDTLSRNIEEIKKLIASEDFDFDDLIRRILAAAYYGTGCQRVLLCRCITQQQTVKARYGVGKKVKHLLKQFQFPLNDSTDVFSQAVQTGNDLVVDDLNNPADLELIPDWFSQLKLARSLALLPFQLASRTRGFLYLDHAEPNYFDRLPAEQLAQLSTLRDLTTQAYQQRKTKAQ